MKECGCLVKGNKAEQCRETEQGASFILNQANFNHAGKG
jgi:hypothetical protein